MTTKTEWRNDAGRSLSIYCPLGHGYVPAGKGEAQKLRERLEAEQQRTEYWRKEREREKAKHAATKGQLTKTKKRVANGLCPCCHRSFVQLSRHMATKHPEYAEVADARDGTAGEGRAVSE